MCKKNRLKVILPPLLSAVVFGLLAVSRSSGDNNLKVPSEYGELVYECNQKSQCHLFIIGISHSDPLTLQNGANTSRVQAEVYKLGEWLVRNQGVELLLPEGFFKSKKAKTNTARTGAALKEKKNIELPDIKTVEERLFNSQTYLNAEMLLKERYHLETGQVEDWVFYDAVRNGISKVFSGRETSSEYFVQKADLDYLQERRTGAMLQNIPGAIADQFGQGNIKEKRAIFTIGLSHVPMIIRYLSEKKIKISSPLFSSDRTLKDYVSDLNLSRENFGVSIIIPRTLANDPRALRMNNLEKIVSDARTQSTVRPLPAVGPSP